MAGALTEEQFARHVYDSLQVLSCPLVEDLNLQDSDSILQLLCVPSQHRTDILTWICCRINAKFSSSNMMSLRSKGPDVLYKEIALLGQELMLCRAEDQDVIREGTTSVRWQLKFLQGLLSLVPGSKPAGPRMDAEMLLNELCAPENLPQLSQMLRPTLDPWPSHIRTLRSASRSVCKVNTEEAADVSSLLQLTRCTLEQLQSECDFLSDTHSPGVFCPSLLRVAAVDLQQLMATFGHVYDTDLRAYCSRDPPSFSEEIAIFQRTHRLLHALITELEMIKEVSEASESMNEEVKLLQTQLCYQSRGQKNTFQNRLEELTRRVRHFSSLLHS